MGLIAGGAQAGQWVALGGGGSGVGRGRGCRRVGYLAEIRGHGRQGRENIKNTKERSPAVQEAGPCGVPGRGWQGLRGGPHRAHTLASNWLFILYQEHLVLKSLQRTKRGDSVSV